ncbi:hypothetical protein PoB_007648100 [Plakobranchus ocellatus]|uniref:Uncharacterized protein n=1 Tax=Plakobranchus ocellatus TaxID=259542 RepID=A0AAV4E1N5_9GAST|nr:hypothetical protein PoB_007648100 [Plakobranchus ocellatus]
MGDKKRTTSRTFAKNGIRRSVYRVVADYFSKRNESDSEDDLDSSVEMDDNNDDDESSISATHTTNIVLLPPKPISRETTSFSICRSSPKPLCSCKLNDS